MPYQSITIPFIYIYQGYTGKSYHQRAERRIFTFKTKNSRGATIFTPGSSFTLNTQKTQYLFIERKFPFPASACPARVYPDPA